MQRFDFWFYGGKIKEKPLIIGSSYREKTRAWINDLRAIMEARPMVAGIGAIISENVDLKASDEVQAAIKAFSRSVVAQANESDSEAIVGFISRQFDLSLKYALIHHAAVSGVNGLYEPITMEDIQWGQRIAKMLCSWKIDVLMSKVVSGDFHRDCEIFKTAILMATRARRKPTFSYMSTRKQALKDWQPKYSESIINVLKKRGEIITKDGRDGVTQYFLTKTDSGGSVR
jgi:hypothetical protein